MTVSGSSSPTTMRSWRVVSEPFVEDAAADPFGAKVRRVYPSDVTRQSVTERLRAD